MASVDDGALRLAIKNTWERLAEIIAETKTLEAKARQDPSLLDDPWVQAHMRFAFIFKDELRAAETLYEAMAHGVKLRTDQLVPAYDAERKLLAIATRALDRLRESGASSMTMDVASPGQMAMAMPAGAAVPAA